MATLITKDILNASLQTLKSLKTDITLSLAFYGLTQGDVSALHGEQQDVVNGLHKDYKALIPATFDKKSKQWVYNRTKAAKLNDKYGIEFQVTSFEDFCNLVCLVADKPVEKTDQEKREAQLKSVTNALVKALTMGIDKDTLAVILKNAEAK